MADANEQEEESRRKYLEKCEEILRGETDFFEWAFSFIMKEDFMKLYTFNNNKEKLYYEVKYKTLWLIDNLEKKHCINVSKEMMRHIFWMVLFQVWDVRIIVKGELKICKKCKDMTFVGDEYRIRSLMTVSLDHMVGNFIAFKFALEKYKGFDYVFDSMAESYLSVRKEITKMIGDKSEKVYRIARNATHNLTESQLNMFCNHYE